MGVPEEVITPLSATLYDVPMLHMQYLHCSSEVDEPVDDDDDWAAANRCEDGLSRQLMKYSTAKQPRRRTG